MKTLTLIAAFILLIGCSVDQSNQIATHNAENNGQVLLNPYGEKSISANRNAEQYRINMAIEKEKNDTYILDITMILGTGSYYISPNSEGTYSGKFKINLDSNSHIVMSDKIIEHPESKEQLNPWHGEPVNYVKTNTGYRQKIILNSKAKDFEVSGTVSFTIEPRCTFQENEFTIYSKSGKISLIQNMNGC
jgi:hypothetical protein